MAGLGGGSIERRLHGRGRTNNGRAWQWKGEPWQAQRWQGEVVDDVPVDSETPMVTSSIFPGFAGPVFEDAYRGKIALLCVRRGGVPNLHLQTQPKQVIVNKVE
ncbi:hypothetical protein OsI_24904 [Oryza sativa Indica Group]|uniref:Uncharacterized protein n=1 Tax=Oryza sativa subsp. indica TaxID=39946 RepID=A2YI69_ORYSI|nr:hypothetical protein OsI_24904 [Oryza sativa Indica Group]